MEWKTDEHGRRYREIGKGAREFEPEIITTHGQFSEEENKNLKIEHIKEKEKRIDGMCPFNNGFIRKCKSDCAFYSDYGCMEKDVNTQNKKCPFNSYLCNKDCMLYDNGCKIVKAMREVM